MTPHIQKAPNAESYLQMINRDTLANRVNEIGIAGGETKIRPGGVLAIAVFDEQDPTNSNYAAITIGQPGEGLYRNLFFVHEKIHRLRKRRLEGSLHQNRRAFAG